MLPDHGSLGYYRYQAIRPKLQLYARSVAIARRLRAKLSFCLRFAPEDSEPIGVPSPGSIAVEAENGRGLPRPRNSSRVRRQIVVNANAATACGCIAGMATCM